MATAADTMVRVAIAEDSDDDSGDSDDTDGVLAGVGQVRVQLIGHSRNNM